MSTERLPIIDLTPLLEQRPGGLEQVASDLGHAARDIGFFYVTGHGIDPALIEATFAAARTLFAQPLETKMELTRDFFRTNRGYVPMKGENLDPSKPSDLKEAFNIGLDLRADDPRILAGEPFRAVNQWPALPGWRDTVLAYFNAVWRLGRQMHRAIAVDLGAAPDFFEDKLDAPLATLRLLHYPPQPPSAEEGQIGAGTHTDYGNITILLPDDVGGLEVQRRDGTWIAAPTIPGAFVCNIGDCLMRWTNDVYVSTPHRVVNRGGRERYSIAFFLDPNPDAEVACMPSCQGPDTPARYPPVPGADYLKMKLDASYEPVRRKSA
ncbi:isopenicillin N synthase family dioxygenase [Polymorphum gilvum]|uniref:2-oxoglutarate-dependent ethylene/succinate-forming enzyme n=1 Tax=Polymorphum gilvum (strain LMG 25793 / CGMCC 1.9160 / SL003B-26A1) TaxID=991905 RepID=F2IWS0_POLGS|nr:2-oxoglutarate and iron-dependent oxygenase domain-containing protein [Polymorphum gilvum]ADZ70395.1 Oxidoreductase, 2OG-Fe(II) oxygenase family [Polymorphum gilvum SL003B-26A1]